MPIIRVEPTGRAGIVAQRTEEFRIFLCFVVSQIIRNPERLVTILDIGSQADNILFHALDDSLSGGSYTPRQGIFHIVVPAVDGYLVPMPENGRVSWFSQSTFFPDALCCCIEAALPVVNPSRSISASCSEALIRS